MLSNVNLDGKDEYWNFEDQSHRPTFWIFYENPMTSVIDASSMGMSLGFSDRSRFVASYHVGGCWGGGEDIGIGIKQYRMGRFAVLI